MPHDLNGNKITEGDTVRVDFVVRQVQTGEDYCNVSLETVLPMYPGEHKSSFTANAKQCAVVSSVSLGIGETVPG